MIWSPSLLFTDLTKGRVGLFLGSLYAKTSGSTSSSRRAASSSEHCPTFDSWLLEMAHSEELSRVPALDFRGFTISAASMELIGSAALRE